MEFTFVYGDKDGASVLDGVNQGSPQTPSAVLRLLAGFATRTHGVQPWALTLTVKGVTHEWEPPVKSGEQPLSLNEFRENLVYYNWSQFVQRMGGEPVGVKRQQMKTIAMLPMHLWAWQDHDDTWYSPQLEDAGCSFCNAGSSGHRSEDGVVAALYVEYLKRY